jgi:CRISPR-associated protein Cas2
MTVIVLTACPSGLRGHLTKWLLEISAGVFVGNVTTRVRNLLWARVVELSGNGRALMVYSVRGEQRLSFKVHGHHWKPADYEGITLIRRPDHDSEPASATTPTNWSKVGNRKRFARRTGKMPDAPTPLPNAGQTE